MANPSIRGHQGSFVVLQKDKEKILTAITSVDINQDSDFSRSFYVGNSVGEGDQSIQGWSGTIETEVKNAEMDLFIDALVTNNLNGIDVQDYSFVTIEKYADGTQSSYLYVDCQFKMSKRQSGLNEKQTKRLEFQAAFRIPI